MQVSEEYTRSILEKFLTYKARTFQKFIDTEISEGRLAECEVRSNSLKLRLPAELEYINLDVRSH